MRTSIEPKRAKPPSLAGVGTRRRGRIAAGTQFLLLLALCATVLVALFLDSRLYHGIGVDGQPIYQENPRVPGAFDVSPASPSGSGESESLHNSAFLDGSVSEWLPDSDGDLPVIAASQG